MPAVTPTTTTPTHKRYSFMNDYSEGMHPAILEALMAENAKQNPGYGLDAHCAEAQRLIRKAADAPNSDVHFISGGTQTNLIAIAVALRPWECVIATQLGHISTHETGAIEATGHKVFRVDSTDGKMSTAHIASALHENNSEHMVQPRMVYISNTTEVGTQYTKHELEEISDYCKAHNLLLFVDGARLACALSSPMNDITLADMARLTDMFYIGGTKMGAMFGEALVVNNDSIKPHVRFTIKQRGALLAKGWMLGLQFEVLMKNNLIFELGAHTNKTAAILRNGLTECGFKFAYDSHSNQQFPIMPMGLFKAVEKEYDCMVFEDRRDGTAVVRFVTSWATPEDACHEFVSSLKRIVAEFTAAA
uniref:Threonine aldolase n=1 Tax=Crithidia acanthocephali TaxID=59798 RepID=U5KLU3_9TRYP|nr:threonine aldolase [Crithidia acanthocephali]